MLLIDRVIDIIRAKRIVAIKNVTINEPFFVGHFPDYPIMPGVLIVEAMAQAGAALLFTEVTDRDDKLLVFTGIERARFRRPVTPGDQLRIEVDVLAFRGTAGRLQGKAYVDGKLACEAVVTCRLLNRVPKQSAEAPQPEPAARTGLSIEHEYSSDGHRRSIRENSCVLQHRTVLRGARRSGAGRKLRTGFPRGAGRPQPLRQQ